MQTDAVFENIAERIQNEIGKAQHTLLIAVAWFTNKNIFNSILLKAKEGCSVSLIISDDAINANSRIDFSQLEKHNGRFYKFGNGDTELMHNKFCVIDNSTVITGSYNWSYKAENNFENVVINYDDRFLAEQFIREFHSLIKTISPENYKEEKPFPVDVIIKRYQIIKNYIQLEEYDELKKEILKLQDYKHDKSVLILWNSIISNDFITALNEIEEFSKQHQAVAIFNDPEIFTLKLEVRILENKLNAFDNEKIELEKTLSDFHHAHTIELGQIILEILKLRRIKFAHDKDKSKEAENDFKEFNEDFEKEKTKASFTLTDDEKVELKKKFRKATFLCHPDKVNDELKDVAQRIFIDLKNANEANDLKKVSEILSDLEAGNFFKHKSETITEKDKLKAYITKLKIQLRQVEEEIHSIVKSETYQLVISITDWTAYFNETKEKLKKELSELEKEISKLNLQ
jgi:hypothetical protein